MTVQQYQEGLAELQQINGEIAAIRSQLATKAEAKGQSLSDYAKQLQQGPPTAKTLAETITPTPYTGNFAHDAGALATNLGKDALGLIAALPEMAKTLVSATGDEKMKMAQDLIAFSPVSAFHLLNSARLIPQPMAMALYDATTDKTTADIGLTPQQRYDKLLGESQQYVAEHPIGTLVGVSMGKGIAKKMAPKEVPAVDSYVNPDLLKPEAKAPVEPVVKGEKPAVPQVPDAALVDIAQMPDAALRDELLSMGTFSDREIALMPKHELIYRVSGGRMGSLGQTKAPVTVTQKETSPNTGLTEAPKKPSAVVTETPTSVTEKQPIQQELPVNGKAIVNEAERIIAQPKPEKPPEPVTPPKAAEPTLSIEDQVKQADADYKAKFLSLMQHREAKIVKDPETGKMYRSSSIKYAEIGEKLTTDVLDAQKHLNDLKAQLPKETPKLPPEEPQPPVAESKLPEPPPEPSKPEITPKPEEISPKPEKTVPVDEPKPIEQLTKHDRDTEIADLEDKIRMEKGRDALEEAQNAGQDNRMSDAEYLDYLRKKDQGVVEEKSAEVVNVPLSSIKTDVDRFQNRLTDFSDKTASQIAESYDPNKFDPIVLWKDPDTGDRFVVSGHSRLEGMKRRNAGTVPARYFEGTEAEAINFAKIEGNRLADKEGLLESINAYKLAAEKKYNQKQIRETFGGDAGTLKDLQHLNPKGQFLEQLTAEGSAGSFPYLKRTSRWVGELRGMYPDKLTNAHEAQLFDYLYRSEKRGYEMPKDDFFNLIQKQLETFDYDPAKPLVLKRGEVMTGTRARADTGEAERKIDELKQRQKEAKTMGEFDALQKDIDKLREGIKEAVKKQTDIFSGILYTGIDPRLAGEIGKSVGKGVKAVGEMTAEVAEHLKKELGSNAIEEVQISKDAMIDHDRAVRLGDLIFRELHKMGSDLLPDKKRRLMVTHYVEQPGKYGAQLTPQERAIGDLARNLRDQASKFATDNHVALAAKRPEGIDYLFHWWKSPYTGKARKGHFGKFARVAPQSLPREHVSIEEGYIKGKQLVHEDPFSLIGEQWRAAVRVAEARKMMKTIGKIDAPGGQTIVLRSGKERPMKVIEDRALAEDQGKDSDYEIMSHPAFVGRWNKNGYALVHKEVAPFLKAYLESPTYGKLAKLGFVVKGVRFSMSLFHPVQLEWNWIMSGHVPMTHWGVGRRLMREGGESFKTLYKEGLNADPFDLGSEGRMDDMFKFSNPEQKGFVKGSAKVADAILAPARLSRDFIFKVVHPDIKVAYAVMEYEKQLSKGLDAGTTKEMLARQVVKKADRLFSGEDYKRTMLESSRFLAQYWYSPGARKVWNMMLLSPTWQKAHAGMFKENIAAFMPDALREKLGMPAKGMERAFYRKYIGRCIALYTAANIYNYMVTKEMDGEGKFIFQNPEGKKFGIRAWWDEDNGNPVYLRPWKSIMEIPEFFSDPFEKIVSKLNPWYETISKQTFNRGEHGKLYDPAGWESTPQRLKDMAEDLGVPMSMSGSTVGDLLTTDTKKRDDALAKRGAAARILPSFGVSVSHVNKEWEQKEKRRKRIEENRKKRK